MKHKRAVLRWIESRKGAISMGTLQGWLISLVCKEAPSSPRLVFLLLRAQPWGTVGHGYCTGAPETTLTPWQSAVNDSYCSSFFTHQDFPSYLGCWSACVTPAWGLSICMWDYWAGACTEDVPALGELLCHPTAAIKDKVVSTQALVNLKLCQ